MRAEPTPSDWDDVSGHSLPAKQKSIFQKGLDN